MALSYNPIPPVGHLFLECDTSTITCTITPVSQKEGLMALIRNTYADYTLDTVGRNRDFDSLGYLAGAVPIRRIHRPDGLDHLPQLCRAILNDLQQALT